MTLSNTPLRLLVKSYSNGLLDRKQYLKIRLQLLKKLSSHGNITHDDLQNFMKIHQNDFKQTSVNQYSGYDWVIIILGLMAATALGIILYN